MEPTITSKNLPPSQQPTAIPPGAKAPAPAPLVEAQIPYERIVAKPLRAPNFINLRHKNPNMSLYWGNRAVGEKESGMRFDQLVAMGFQTAKPDEVFAVSEAGKLLPMPASLVRDGRIIYGDLILLKIPRADYIGSQKWNEQSARLRVRRPGTTLEGTAAEHQTADSREQPADAFKAIVANPLLAKKVQAFVPSLAETDALTKDNS